MVRQISLSFYLALWALSLWGLIWHFVADQLMAEGFRDLPYHIDIVIGDTQRYLNNTHAQAVHWSEVNYKEELEPGFGNAVNNMAWGMQSALYQINEPEYTGMNRITGLPHFLIDQCEVGNIEFALMFVT